MEQRPRTIGDKSQERSWCWPSSPPLPLSDWNLHPNLSALRACMHARSWLTLVTPWTVACRAPLSMGFPRQEHWSGLPCPPPGGLPDPGVKLHLLHILSWQAGSSPLSRLRGLSFLSALFSHLCNGDTVCAVSQLRISCVELLKK